MRVVHPSQSLTHASCYLKNDVPVDDACVKTLPCNCDRRRSGTTQGNKSTNFDESKLVTPILIVLETQLVHYILTHRVFPSPFTNNTHGCHTIPAVSERGLFHMLIGQFYF